MIDVTATLAGIDALEVRLDVAVFGLVDEIAEETGHRARALAPVGFSHGSGPDHLGASVPGTLRDSILVAGPFGDAAGGWEALVGPTVIYGRLRELGGTIVPVTKPALRWWDVNGLYHSARVTRPRGRPYLKPALESVDVSAVVGRFLTEAIIG